MTVAAFFEQAGRAPNALAIGASAQSRRLTYGELAGSVRGLASRLAAAGMKPGDRIAFVLENGAEWIALHYAIMAAGGVSVPIDAAAPGPVIQYVLAVARPAMLVAERSSAAAALAGAGSVPVYALDATAEERGIASLPSPGREAPLAGLSGSDRRLALLIFTTGTTGKPKAVRLSEQNLAASASNIMKFCGVGPGDVEVTALPLTRMYGMAHVHGFLAVGGALVVEKNLRVPARTLNLIEEFGAVSFPGVPASLEILTRQYGPLLASAGASLRYVMSCSAPLRPALVSRLRELLPRARIINTYGLTEAVRSTMIDLTDPALSEEQRASVGRSVGDTVISILGKDGRAVPAGEAGEIVLRGSIVTEGYWERPEENAQCFGPLGFRTGDLGRLDAEGRLYLTGRIKDIINVGGRKLTPGEVEEAILTVPGVKDCAVIGVPDDLDVAGEKVRAFIVRAGGATLEAPDLIRQLRTLLEPYKVPQDVVFVDGIPRTISGKTQYYLLREQAAPQARA